MARIAATVDEIETPAEVEKPEESTDGKESRQPKLSPLGFFEDLSRFSNVEWEQHIVYVYRLAPITDRTAGGTTKYVQKYGSRFDQETLKADLGSGRYRLQLNRYGEKGQSKTIRTFEIDIEDMNFPPKVPPGEWLDDPRNKRWAWARNKMQPENGQAAGDSWTPERIMRMVKELRPEVKDDGQLSITRAVLDAVKETRAELGAASNPQQMISTLKELILIAKPDAPAKPQESNEHFQMLIRMFEAAEKRAEAAAAEAREERKRADEDRKRAHDIDMLERKHQHERALEELKQRANAADPLDMVKKVLTLKKELGGDEPDNRKWPEKLVDEGMQHVPELLGLASRAIDKLGYRRTEQPAQPAQQRPQQQPVAAQAPSQTQTSQPPPTQPPANAAPPAPEEPSDPDIAFLLPIFEAQGARFVQAFQQDPNGGGHHIAKDVLFYAGAAVYERIARMGVEKILATIHLIDAMEKDLLKVGTKEMLTDFINDFIEGPDEDEDDGDDPYDGEDDDPSRPVETVGKKVAKVTA